MALGTSHQLIWCQVQGSIALIQFYIDQLLSFIRHLYIYHYLLQQSQFIQEVKQGLSRTMRKARIKLLEQRKTQKIDEPISHQILTGTQNYHKYSLIINSIKGTEKSLPKREKLLEKLRASGFRIEEIEREQGELSINLCTVSKRLDSVVVEVGIGGIYKEIKILIVDAMYQITERKIVGVGEFGIINPLKIGHSEYVIKSMKVSKEKQVINFIIAEYFYCSIASALDAGPFLPKNQYDVICFSDRICFVMEKCGQISSSLFDFKAQNDLLESMQCLHELQIVHRDIKPENIMYSPSKQKAVFIDFGMSKMLEEKIGQVSSTLFVGTYVLVCQEMKNLYHNQCYGQVDLYYNDAYALQLSLRSFKKSLKDDSLILSKSLKILKCSSDPIIDTICVGAKFIYALHYSGLSILLSILNDFPSFHQLFLYLFSLYCSEQLEISPITHPYYEKFKLFDKKQCQNEEKLYIVMKILSKLRPQLAKIFIQSLQLKQICKIKEKKIHYKVVQQLRQQIFKTDDINKQFYLECLISAIHNYPYSFSHEDRVAFIEAAIKNLLPEYSEQNFQKKLFKIYGLMEEVFRKSKQKQKENLKKINFYYFLNYFKDEYFKLEDFIIEECCGSLQEKLEEAILSIVFIFGQENVDILYQKNGPSLSCKIKNLLNYKNVQSTQSQHLSILYSILQELITTTQHFNHLQGPGLEIKNMFNSIKELLKNQSLNGIFVKQLLDTFAIIEGVLELHFIHEFTEIPKLKLFFFKSEVIFKYLVLQNVVKFKSYRCIEKIIESNWYLKFIQPKEIIYYYLFKNEVEQAEARVSNEISLKNYQLGLLQQMYGTLIAWVEADQVTEAFLKFKAFFFFKILDKIVEICQKNKSTATVGLSSIDFIICNINFLSSIKSRSEKLEGGLSEKQFKDKAQDKIIQLINLPEIESSAKKAFEIMMKYLEKRPEEKYQVALQIMELINNKNEEIQKINEILIRFVCLIWNSMGSQSPQEITIRKFILQTIESSIENQGLASLYKIPDAVLAKVLITEKKHILFLDFFKNYAERFSMHQNVILDNLKGDFFYNLEWQDLLAIKNYFIETETLQNIRKHGNFSYYILQIFRLTHFSMTQKEKRRFLLLTYMSLSQYQTSAKLRYLIQWSLVGVWDQVNDYSNRSRSMLFWLRNTVRKTRRISQYSKLLIRAIKKVKKKEVKLMLKKKIRFVKEIKEQNIFPFDIKE